VGRSPNAPREAQVQVGSAAQIAGLLPQHAPPQQDPWQQVSESLQQLPQQHARPEPQTMPQPPQLPSTNVSVHRRVSG
jgi:hypothetical protein